MNDDLPDVSVSPARKVFLSGASVIWIIPILALLVALTVAWQSYNERGPLITVEFENGAGIQAGETELKFRDVTIGVVEKVGFTASLSKVTAQIRVEKDVAPFIDASAVFWIVQPEVTAQGITGLSTVLSGVYIEGSWDDKIGAFANLFQGASEAPLIRPGQSGLEIAFRTTANGQLTDNAPILYKGIEVGRVGRAKIDPRNNYAVVEALIFEEHRTLVNNSTRFWDASGFSVTLGPAGAEIDFSSLATLVGGGITFDTFVSGGDRVQDGTVFEIFPDKETARNSVFNASEVTPLKMSVIFEDNISGLVVGAPVELSGLKIGEVEALSGIVDYNQFGDSRVRLNVNLSIQPARLGLPVDVNAENALLFLQERVTNGLRARLASASLLTGGLKVELVMVEDAPPARLVADGDALPILPTTFSETSDAAATVEGVFTRINNLPIEELLNSAISFLNSAEALVTDEDLRETPQDLRLLLAELQGLVTSDDVQNIPVALNATLTRVETLVAALEREQIAERLSAALEGATAAANSVTTSVEGVPAMVEQIQAVAAKAETLELNQLVDELTALTKSADAVIGTDAAVALPGSLKRALDEVNYTLQELREGGAIENVNKTLASARNAADNIAVSAKDLPNIVDRLTSLFAQASRTIEGYNKGEEISRSAQDTLRDIQKAADALASLARTIERNPNSLLLGR
ncbi:intermembrane transport protein PqiB [Sulfitobacter mediterraneus]|uniref:Paraquat-inducible protein B n=1 Tax=Sulfitobacter mediterraneus TaxID=83219 RepID=A0A2T6CEE2_9RHOB|nr:MlaD family protein [Sulfitobacter mediterraneus]KIN76177.1 Paraquat-inducible protein B [Sulfitobacter mediterraneus KCTC 32188]PTX73845.1 paraquat-inducible protein B [Sulfitobacter mediterraneus]